jgi:type IV pilus assembly protein PilB
MSTAENQRKPLGRLLVERGVVSEEQLGEMLAEQAKDPASKLLGELAVEMNFAEEAAVAELLAEGFGVPFARVGPRLVDPAAMTALPRELVERHGVLPMFVVDGTLTLAMSEPANVFLIEELERVAGLKIQVVAATSVDIDATLRAYLPDERAFVLDRLIDDAATPEELTVVKNEEAEDIGDLAAAADDSPVIKLVNFLIFSAVREAASDVHIEPQDGALRVRFRVDGVLRERLTPPKRMQGAMISRIKIMAGLDIAERRLPQDGAVRVQLDKRPIDLRVSTMPGRHGEKVVLRIIAADASRLHLDRLGFGADTLRQWRKLIARPHGITLVTGPTGSGKSTTLYASLNELARDDVNICTVEDPVENTLAGLNQFQINEKAGFTFAAALRALLRQDPDVMMIGEVRDVETARLATQASLTGHAVLSTLHTNDAVAAAPRLFDLGIEPYLVGATLNGVLAQRLVRRLCDGCKQLKPAQPIIARQLEKIVGRQPEELAVAVGCDKCGGTGYSGRIGIYELFAPGDALTDAITQGRPLNELRQLAKDGGMTDLRHDGAHKVIAGVTTYEETLRATA